MFKLRNFTVLSTKWAHFRCDSCYGSLTSWTPWWSISSSSLNSLKTSGHPGSEILEFWCWTWSHSWLIEVSSCWRVLVGLMMLQMFSPGQRSGLQVQFSSWTLLWCGSTSFCWNTQDLPWNRRGLEGSRCSSETFIDLSTFIVPSRTSSCHTVWTYGPHHQRCWF